MKEAAATAAMAEIEVTLFFVLLAPVVRTTTVDVPFIVSVFDR